MKKFILALCLLFTAPVFAVTKYYCNCDTGSAVGCVAGVNGNSGLTPALARQTLAQFASDWQGAAAGDSLLMCQGGLWDSAATGAIKNSNATRSNPVTVDSYDATSVWSGGAGIKPILKNTSTVNVIQITKGTLTHSEGYVFRNLSLQGGGTNGAAAILAIGDNDYVTFDGFTINGFEGGIQCNGGSTSSSATNDGITTNWTIKNLVFTSINANGILTGCGYSTIQNNTFLNVGTDFQDHSIYLTGAIAAVFPKTIVSITGTGAVATLTATAHGIPVGTHFVITVSGSTSSGSGTFNATNAVGTVTGANTLTYAATGTPSASVVGTYTANKEVPLFNMTVRNNLMTDNNVAGAGLCSLAAIVAHGAITNLLIENNKVNETVVNNVNGTPSSCVGIEVDSGGYAAPEDFEFFKGLVIRNNTTINTALGIGVDLSQGALVENNYHYSGYSANSVAGGIRMRSKNTTPGTAGPISTQPANATPPDNNTIRYNTAYLTTPNTGHWGIALNGNIGDPLTGLNHNLYGNVVVLGSSASTTTECFDTSNMTLAMFAVKDYNACYYLSASVPKWENTSSLATIQAGGNPNKSDLHSLMAATASVTAGQPFFITPTTSPAISTSSALKNAGHPTLGPKNGWGGSVRNQGVRDIGAFEFGAALGVVPNSPTP